MAFGFMPDLGYRLMMLGQQGQGAGVPDFAKEASSGTLAPPSRPSAPPSPGAPGQTQGGNGLQSVRDIGQQLAHAFGGGSAPAYSSGLGSVNYGGVIPQAAPAAAAPAVASAASSLPSMSSAFSSIAALFGA